MASTRGRRVVVPYTNKSGGSLAVGDVVIVDTSNNTAVTTTTSARSETTVGVCQTAAAADAEVLVLLAGKAELVNVPASVTRGHYVETHTVAKQATGNSTRRSGSFGQFLTGGTTPTAVLWGAPDQTATASTTPPDCKSAVITTDVTLGTPNTWTDSGLSLSLEAGTWLVQANMMIRTTQAGTELIAIRLTDGSTVYANNGLSLVSNNGQENNLVTFARITLGSTTTVKAQGIGVVRTAVIEADGNDAALTDNVVSFMTALKVTSA